MKVRNQPKLQRVGLNALSGNLNNTAPSIGTIAGWCSDQRERNITTGLFGLLTVDTPLRLIQQKNHEYQTRLNETRFGPKKKSSPIYLGPKNLDTFWCTGWAWNCQIIFRCTSNHGRAGFILVMWSISQVLVDRTQHPPLFPFLFSPPHFHGLEICKTAIICRFLIA
jgi:hypothetical protein